MSLPSRLQGSIPLRSLWPSFLLIFFLVPPNGFFCPPLWQDDNVRTKESSQSWLLWRHYCDDCFSSNICHLVERWTKEFGEPRRKSVERRQKTQRKLILEVREEGQRHQRLSKKAQESFENGRQREISGEGITRWASWSCWKGKPDNDWGWTELLNDSHLKN